MIMVLPTNAVSCRHQPTTIENCRSTDMLSVCQQLGSPGILAGICHFTSHYLRRIICWAFLSTNLKKSKFQFWSRYIWLLGLAYQDGNTSSPITTEIRHLELNQFSDWPKLMGSDKWCHRNAGTMLCQLRYPFPLAPCMWQTNGGGKNKNEEPPKLPQTTPWLLCSSTYHSPEGVMQLRTG